MPDGFKAALQVRLPSDLKAFIKAEAERNLRPQNSEILIAVRERMEKLQVKEPT